MKNVIVIGAGGHGKVVAEIVKESGDCLVGFLDSIRNSGEYMGVPILGYDYEFEKFKDNYFIVAIGNQYIRRKIVKRMIDVDWYTAISPRAYISSAIKDIGVGTVVAPNAVINPGAMVGKHCIINTGCVVEHDNVIHSYAHISVGALLGGKVMVGENTWVGIGAAIKDHVSITSDCMIGVGSVVVKDIEQAGTYVGVPARKIKEYIEK